MTLKLGPNTAINSHVLHHHKELAMTAVRETMMADREISAVGDQRCQPCWVESGLEGGPQLSMCAIFIGLSPLSGPKMDRVRGHREV